MTGAAAPAAPPRGGASASQPHAAAPAGKRAGCEPVRKAGPVTMEHVLLALHETEAEREARIRDMFAFFDTAGSGQLDYAQIEAGLAALQVPAECKYARELLRACDRDRDGRVGYDDFRRYMDDKELELYRIFQAIDVEHNGCILPEELWDALIKAGMCFLGRTTLLASLIPSICAAAPVILATLVLC
jgi:solute carrier family 25 (mitochondrial phosphate transporter), member 23/24/25/41